MISFRDKMKRGKEKPVSLGVLGCQHVFDSSGGDDGLTRDDGLTVGGHG